MKQAFEEELEIEASASSGLCRESPADSGRAGIGRKRIGIPTGGVVLG